LAANKLILVDTSVSVIEELLNSAK
jgi:hypothetical protein